MMMKKTITACIAAMALSASGEIFQTTDLFSIDLPDGWDVVPVDVLDAFALKNEDISSNAPAQYYDYGYQAASTNGQWLSYPYVLIQVQQVGRIPSSELAKYQKLGSEMQEFTLPEVSVGDAVYDKENQTLWSTLATHTDDGTPVKALVAVKLTEVGYIRLMGCATEDAFGEYEPIFRKAFSTLGIDASIAYKPQMADAIPSVGGIKTGKVLVWFVQAVVIGGILWALYVPLRRKLKK